MVGSVVGLFGRKKKSVPLEEQLAALAELGVRMSDGAEEEDLFAFESREELEAEPFGRLAEALARSLERPPWTPIADRLWLCDLECIEDDGAYVEVVERLERMTEHALGLDQVEDRVSLDEPDGGVAWVQFAHRGETVRWELEVADDWCDPGIFVCYDRLLRDSGSALRLHVADGRDHGQSVFLAAFDARDAKRFSKLAGIRLVPVR